MRSRALPVGAAVLGLALVLGSCADRQEASPGDAGDTASNDTAAGAVGQVPDACRPGQETDEQVEVSLRGQGAGARVVVSPDTVRIREGGDEELRWVGDHPFIVIFKPRNGVLPTRAATAASRAVDTSYASQDTGRSARARSRTNPEAPCGEYRFDVAVWNEAEGRLVGVDPPLLIVP